MAYINPKDKIKCKLIIHSTRPHIAQVLTGFSLLEDSGFIKLSQEFINVKNIDTDKPYHLRDAKFTTHICVLLNEKIKIYYDMHDSCEINEKAVSESDFYFKRSYHPGSIPPNLTRKVFPFGLNYLLYSEKANLLEISRIFHIRDNWRIKCTDLARLIRFLGKISDLFYYVPTATKIFSEPDYKLEPKVLFMTHVWNPFEEPCCTKKRVDEWEHLNEIRAKCIELLRKEFKNSFLGGLKRTPYALKNFKNLVFNNKAFSGRRKYLQELRKFPICISTTGLHGSIGWKMGEYVAFSKAILSEPLNNIVPGDFSHGNNYLEFRTPEQCVENAVNLFKNRELRERLMGNNHHYYLNFLKPDILVSRTLKIALQNQNEE